MDEQEQEVTAAEFGGDSEGWFPTEGYDDEQEFAIARAALEAAGFEDIDATDIEQMRVFIICMRLFKQRNGRYKDLWMQYGWTDSVHHVRHKAARIVREFVHHQDADPDPDPADVWDLINYGVFLIRNLAARNKYGRN